PGAGKGFTLDADKQKLAGAPKITEDQADQMATPEFLNTVDQYWNQKPWWQGAAQPTGRAGFGNVHKISELKGMEVKNVENQDLGKIDTVALDMPAGRVLFVILAPGGTLPSQGNMAYALSPNALTKGPDGKTLVSDLDKN